MTTSPSLVLAAPPVHAAHNPDFLAERRIVVAELPEEALAAEAREDQLIMTAPSSPLVVACNRPILAVRFRERQRMLSWSISRPGFVETDAVAWLEVRDADLPVGRDPLALLEDRLARAGLAHAVGLMTACDVRAWRTFAVTVEDVTATVVATVGLGNGELVGRRRHAIEPWTPAPPETINTLVHVSRPLRDAALLETLSIVAQARTLAVLEATMGRGDILTGTGSDCIVVACPPGGGAPYAGLHTAIGEAVGAAVLGVIRGAASCWLNKMRKSRRIGGARSRPPRTPAAAMTGTSS